MTYDDNDGPRITTSAAAIVFLSRGSVVLARQQSPDGDGGGDGDGDMLMVGKQHGEAAPMCCRAGLWHGSGYGYIGSKN